MRTRSVHLLGRCGVVIAAVLCGSLAFAGPASALCSVAAVADDGSAETFHDHDYVDDTSIKYLTLASTPVVATSAALYMEGSAYGGCGLYALRVNGALDHTFDTCSSGWNFQAIQNTAALASGTNTFEVQDLDGTWDTGIFFDVDTGRSGSSVMVANGIPKTGELMWRLYVTAVACL